MGMEYYIILKSFPRAESPGHRKLLHRFFFFPIFVVYFIGIVGEPTGPAHRDGSQPGPTASPSLSSSLSHLSFSRALLHTPAATAANNLRSPANPSPALSPPSSVRCPTIQPLPPLGDQKKPQWRRLGLGDGASSNSGWGTNVHKYIDLLQVVPAECRPHELI